MLQGHLKCQSVSAGDDITEQFCLHNIRKLVEVVDLWMLWLIFGLYCSGTRFAPSYGKNDFWEAEHERRMKQSIYWTLTSKIFHIFGKHFLCCYVACTYTLTWCHWCYSVFLRINIGNISEKDHSILSTPTFG